MDKRPSESPEAKDGVHPPPPARPLPEASVDGVGSAYHKVGPWQHPGPAVAPPGQGLRATVRMGISP